MLVMYTMGGYCISMAFSFAIIAVALMRRVIKSANLSGIATNPVVICRLLGSGTVFFVAYLIQVELSCLACFETSHAITHHFLFFLSCCQQPLTHNTQPLQSSYLLFFLLVVVKHELLYVLYI